MKIVFLSPEFLKNKLVIRGEVQDKEDAAALIGGPVNVFTIKIGNHYFDLLEKKDNQEELAPVIAVFDEDEMLHTVNGKVIATKLDDAGEMTDLTDEEIELFVNYFATTPYTATEHGEIFSYRYPSEQYYCG